MMEIVIFGDFVKNWYWLNNFGFEKFGMVLVVLFDKFMVF